MVIDISNCKKSLEITRGNVPLEDKCLFVILMKKIVNILQDEGFNYLINVFLGHS